MRDGKERAGRAPGAGRAARGRGSELRVRHGVGELVSSATSSATRPRSSTVWPAGRRRRRLRGHHRTQAGRGGEGGRVDLRPALPMRCTRRCASSDPLSRHHPLHQRRVRRAFAAANQGTPDHVLEGSNYLAVCRVTGAESPEAEPPFTQKPGAPRRGRSRPSRSSTIAIADREALVRRPRHQVPRRRQAPRRRRPPGRHRTREGAEEELREREAQLGPASDSRPSGSPSWARDARFLEANAQFCDLLGYSQEEILSA